MSATSKHPGDVAKWIEKVIDSCETSQQLLTTLHLIQNFEKVYNRSSDDFISYFSRDLRNRWSAHHCSRTSIFAQIEERELYKENEEI
jgi:hypothetical protein